MRQTTRMNIKKAISIALCMAMVSTFTIRKPIGAEEITNEDVTTEETSEEITTEESSEDVGTLTGNFSEDVDYLVKKGKTYDLKEVYEVYENAPREINPKNTWVANEADSEKISQFQEILEELAKQNHTDEETGVFVTSGTPWYIKIEVKEIDTDSLQKAYNAYLERQQEVDDEDDYDEDDEEAYVDDEEKSDDGEELDSAEEEENSSENDSVDEADDEDDWDDEDEKRTPLQEDAALYKAYQYGEILGVREYDNHRTAESKVGKSYQVRFYNAVTGEEYQCEQEQYIRIFFPYQRAYLGYDTEVFEENDGDFNFYETYLFDEEETGTYENSDEEEQDEIEENQDDDEEDAENWDDTDEDDQNVDSEEYDVEEDGQSEEDINDAIDYSRYDIVCEINSPGIYGIMLSEMAVSDSEGMAEAKNTKATVQTGDETGNYFGFFFGASMLASIFLLTGRRKKYVQ